MQSFLQQLPTLVGVLVGAGATYAGREWHQDVFHLEHLAYGEPAERSLMEAINSISQSRRHFYEVAKCDIGIEIGGSFEAYEWQLGKLVEKAGGLNWYKSQRQAED